MKSYWFRPKMYGYGLQPVTWQGWLALGCLVCVILAVFYVNGLFGSTGVSLSVIVRSLLDALFLLVSFHVIFRDYTKGDIRWTWGNK